jgi:hypothetical protein
MADSDLGLTEDEDVAVDSKGASWTMAVLQH